MSANRFYRRGYSFERLVRKFYEGRGFHVARSAGSHTRTDLIAVRATTIETHDAFTLMKQIQIPEVLFIQCKAEHSSLKKLVNRTELANLTDLAAKHAAKPVWVDLDIFADMRKGIIR